MSRYLESDTQSVLITSNARGRTWSLSVRNGHLKACGILVLVGVILTGAVLVDYVALRAQLPHFQATRIRHEELSFRLNGVRSQLGSLERALKLVSESVEKISKITNLTDRRQLLDPQIGGSWVAHDDDHSPVSPAATPQGGPLSPASMLDRHDDLHNEMSSEELLTQNRQPASLHEENFSERIDQAIETTQNLETQVLSLITRLDEHKSLMLATPSIRPTFGWHSSRFGYRLDPFVGRPALHNGLDFAVSPGTPIWATADGVVRFAGYQSGYGQLVVIDHGFGVETRYAHNSRVVVSTGAKVNRRDMIAYSGNSGRSTGPHLHYEVRLDGTPVNPVHYIIEID